MGGGPLVPFGSFVQRTCCQGSDLDVAIVTKSSTDQEEQLERLAERVSTVCSGFTVLDRIFSARVPILRLQGDDLLVDVSIGSFHCNRADVVIADYIEELGC